MNNTTWQLVASLAVVAIAAFVLARRVYRFVNGKSGGACGTGKCASGGCGNAASSGSTSGIVQRPLVQLGDPNRSAHDRTSA